jgi:hypothetical protein
LPACVAADKSLSKKGPDPFFLDERTIVMLPKNCVSVVCLLVLALLSGGSLRARDPDALDILGDQYPRAFFFRVTESAFSERRYPTYESWARQFSRLQGIMGKCLDEECLGREPRNPEFFSRFKRDHPNQVVLLHFNGNARDPRYHTEKYSAGHWIYRRAVAISEDVPAESGETLIHVADTDTFRVNTGRYQTSNDDIALFRKTRDGKHDWDYCEQVQLIEVNRRDKTITVKRGCYGTKPLAFRADQSRAAAHVVEGPWGRNNHLMWFYNFATHCPSNEDGKTCADLLVEDLAEWFGPGGMLAAFDGLEFDVMHNQTRGDTDGDGVADDGVVDGINQYGTGMVEFARRLRQRMTDDFIIQGDGALGPGGSRSQRAWQILNGIESEGWPNLNDWEFEDWSGGLNRHFFWQANARSPVFNYVNHKWTQAVPDQPGGRAHPKVPYSRHRLVFAASQLFDAMLCYSFAPPADADRQFGVWDELRCGSENRLGWLGKPEGKAVRLAWQTPDLLQGAGTGASLAERIRGRVTTRIVDGAVVVSADDREAKSFRFTIGDIPTNGTDLCLALDMSGKPRVHYPREMARLVYVGVSGGMVDLMAEKPVEIGMKLRGAETEVPLDESQGATFRDRTSEIAGTRMPTFFVHPPYRQARGYTYWEQVANVPEDGELRFFIGMGKLSPSRSDGVRFEVFAAVVDNETHGPFSKLFEQTTNKHQWLPQSVSLDKYAGRRVRFKFVADCGPHNDATTDHAHWGSVAIAPKDTSDESITKSVKYMTWLNERPFTSGFYYREIKSKTVDVFVIVEGSEEVELRSLRAHAHPDIMYRVFERGLVLANPARRPVTLSLQKLTPGRSYRRIPGVVTQDPVTNNGQRVSGTLTLGERDGRFLVRSP